AQMDDPNTAYNISFGLTQTRTLARQALTRALQRIVARPDSLRSRFSQEDEDATEQAAPATPEPAIYLHDLRGHEPQ
ncbi:hypothetical protein RA279_30665, partial [Pseudomonas syringae pv. tagetis]|uniref:hypothetical protein n=1 Tax=Pseudomonas syringae group genomosp. 7 TaxID=251699 RepID=UPI00376F677C